MKSCQNRWNNFNTIASVIDTGLIASTVIIGGPSIAAFTGDAGLPVGITLSGTSLLFSLKTGITWKPFKIFSIKQEQHDSIKLLAQNKLDSIVGIISQTMQNGYTTYIEFHKVLQEVKNIENFRQVSETNLKSR